jgi:hypothetical protein
MTYDARQRVAELLSRLRGNGLVYCPIRHHSPACALHVRAVILALKPSAVLIEGPSDLTPLIPLILHPRTRAPFAAYTTYIDKTGRLAKSPEEPSGHDPVRRAGYYPFCDYSPELVALRTGREVDADLRFIDLTYPQQVLAEKALAADRTPRSQSLLQERYLRRSDYLRFLSHRAGCRDVNELWDHLFETDARAADSKAFFQRVAAYCCIARLDTAAELLETDGTTAREHAMAAAIRGQMKSNKNKGRSAPVVVVTGGFHTAVLPYLVSGKGPLATPEKRALTREEMQTVLMRYGFDQLDALNGYAAGMPSPQYYEQLWQRHNAGDSDPFRQVAAQVIVGIGRLARAKELPFALSTADEIAALEQAERLARLRGHPGPTREDLLDGVRGSFVKGSLDAEGAAVMGIVSHVLGGSQIGDIPPEAGVPPLVEDFRRGAAELKLTIDDTVPKKLSLDIYRSDAHRHVSRFLHCLAFLNAPFGTLTGGPDFVHGRGLDLMQEHWSYAWSPMTESALIEASLYGSTVEEAALSRLRQAVADLELTGQSRNTAAAVRMLVHACRMGLHRHVSKVLELIQGNIAEDPSFASLVGGLTELVMLWRSREPLEAHRLAEIPILVQGAYRRACFLAQELGTCPPDQVDAALAGLASLQQALAMPVEDLLDQALLLDSLGLVLAAPKGTPAIIGGVTGVLFGSGRMQEEALLRHVTGHLAGATSNPAAKAGFLRGLLLTCRETAWRVPAMLHRINELLAQWDEDEFVKVLPDLRLAFACLTPRETDRVATAVAGLYGRRDLGSLVRADLTEAEMTFNLRLNQAVIGWLGQEGLTDWGAAPREPAASEGQRA